MKRHLLVTLRDVTVAQADYDGLWAQVRDTVTVLGGRAWRFRSPDRPALHLEFVEWKQETGGATLVESDDVAAALRELDAAGSVRSREEWEEAG